MIARDLFQVLAAYIKLWLEFVWQILMASPANEFIARLLYFPTIVRLMLLSSPKRPWYNRVDDTVILGALPLRRLTKEVIRDFLARPELVETILSFYLVQLVEKEKVRALLSFCQPYELSCFTNSKEVSKAYVFLLCREGGDISRGSEMLLGLAINFR